jgi:hypothetical protein
MTVEVAQEETATPEPQGPEIAPDAPQAAPEVPIGPDAEGMATQFAALLARIEALESRLEAAENVRRTEPEAENGASEAAQLPADNNLTRARRLRIVRCYLTLRKQRQQLRAGIAAECARAEDAEFRAADLTHQLEQAQARLAEETARADSADGRWQIVLDSKQARIVALENDLLERLSGGRVKLTPPLRANATPLWPTSIHGRVQ